MNNETSVESAASIALNKGPQGPRDLGAEAALAQGMTTEEYYRASQGPVGSPGTPPDYAVPAEVPAMKCYLCSYGFPSDVRVNWRGHWICPGCYATESVNESVHPNLVGPVGPPGLVGHRDEPGPPRPANRDVTGRLLPKEQVDYILNPKSYPRPVSAHTILEQAASTIEQRGQDYNSPGGERSMKATVEAFNTIRGHSLSVVDGWAFMEVLKMVRAKHSPHKVDNFLDGAAYAALAGEESLNQTNK